MLAKLLSGLAGLSAATRPGPLLHAFAAFAWSVYAFETYLDVRQHRTFAVKNKPKEISYATQEEFDKAQKYGHDKSTFGFITGFWSTAKLTAQLYFGYYPVMWALAATLLESSGYSSEYALLHTAVFYILDATVETVLSTPFSLYKTFVIEQRHGFNKSTLGLFFSDQLKGLLLNAVIAPPLLSLFIVVIEWGGQHFYLYVAALLLVVQLLAVPFYSNVIQPLFNKVEPLPPGELRTEIEKLADSIHFPLKGLFVIDGSKRSSHSNAYFYGFFKHKRIVLFDTLIAQCTQSQVLAVLGHELGHWKLSHTIKGLLLSQLQTLLLFFCFGQMIHNPRLYSDFGFHHSTPTYIGLLLFSFLYSPVHHLSQFLGHLLSRRYEFQADAFAVRLGYAEHLAGGLVTLQKENKGTMIADPLYSAYHHSHPPLLQRLQAIQEEQKKTKKE